MADHEPPYPRQFPDMVPYREFDALSRRVGFLEQKQIGEALVRLEERQHVQTQQLAELRQAVAGLDGTLETLQATETQRAGFKLGTKELVIMVGAFVAIVASIIGAVATVVSIGG